MPRSGRGEAHAHSDAHPDAHADAYAQADTEVGLILDSYFRLELCKIKCTVKLEPKPRAH